MKLKTRFTLIISIFVVTILAVIAFFTFSHYKKSIKDAIAQQQFRMVSILADEIDSKLLAAQQHIVSVAQAAPPDIMQHPEKTQAFLDNMPSLHIMFDNKVFLFTPSGKMFVESPDAPGRRGLDFSFREYLSNTIKTNKPYISDPYISSQLHKHPAIMFTVPLFDGKGKIKGILAGSVDLMRDNFLGKIGSVKIGESGNLYLYDTDGTIIMHPNKKRILVKQPRGLNRLYDAARDGFEGTGETTTSYGIKTVSSFKRLKTKNWILAANSLQNEAYRPLHQAEHYFLIATVIGLIAVFFIISYIMKYLIKPIELFTRHIEELPQKTGDDRFLNIKTHDEIGTLSAAFNEMETERKQAEEAMRLNAARVQALLSLNQMTHSTLQEVIDYALEETVRLTQSKIGYLALFNEDETVMMLHSWSKQVMQECSVIDKPVHFIVKETGLLGEAVRERRPVITNDYAAPNPLKKGYPTGHVTVRRHMSVPVFVGRHIVLLAGVGNKDVDYNDNDVQQLTLLMEGMWLLIERNRAEDALKMSEENFRILIDRNPVAMAVADKSGKFIYFNSSFIETFGYTLEDIPTVDDWWPLAYPEREYRQKVIESWRAAAMKAIKNKNRTESQEWRVRCKDGASRDIEFRMTSLQDVNIVIFNDTTERRRAGETIRQLAAIVEFSDDAIFSVTMDGIIISWNNGAGKLYGYTKGEAINHSVSMLVPPARLEESPILLERIRRGEVVDHYETVRRRKDGTLIEVAITMSPMKDADKITGASVIARDITESKKTEEILRRLSTTDELTGLANRRAFDLFLDEEWRRALRDRRQISLMMIDVDFFKKYNDRYGHLKGDACLKSVANVLEGIDRRPGDKVARFGGEEFVVVLSSVDNQHAVSIAEKIRMDVEALGIPHEKSDINAYVTISIGVVSIVPQQNMSPVDVIKLADEALYRAKGEGRNRVEI